jgi:galactitol-specific phosphotransferase system IIB component
MANCNVQTYTGKTAVTDAATFIATIDDAKIIAVCGFTAASSPTIIIVYKT